MASSASYNDAADDELITEINVTPLVDIVLVLLIVFMITMPTIARMDALKEREMRVELPRVSGGRPLTMPPRQVVISVDAEGKYSVEGQPRTDSQLHDILKLAATADPGNVTVNIRADKRCRWQYVAAIMSHCNQVNIRNYKVSVSE